MPFYPALPEYRPASPAPFTSLIGGFTAGQGLQKQAAETQVLREAAQQPARQREAMAAAQKGDTSQLYTVAPELAMRWDENKRKVAAGAGDYIMQNAPYINDPEQYKQFYNDFFKLHPSASKAMLPSPDRVTSPGQVRQIMDTGVRQAIDVKRQLGELESKQEVAKAKTISKDIRIPEMREQAKLTLDRDLKVQEAYGKIQSDFLDRRIKFDEGVKSEAIQEKREQMIMTNYRYEINELQKEKERLNVEIDKLGLPPDQAETTKKENELRFNRLANQAADHYRSYADRYKLAWNPPRLPEAPTRPTGGGGFKQPGMYRGPDGKPIPIRTQEEYDRIFKGYAGAPRG